LVKLFQLTLCYNTNLSPMQTYKRYFKLISAVIMISFLGCSDERCDMWSDIFSGLHMLQKQ